METGPDKGKTSLRRKNGALRSRITRHSDGGKGKTQAGAGLCWKCGASLGELDAISREAERELGDFKFPDLGELKWPELKLPDFEFPEIDLSGVLEPLPHYSGPVIAEVGEPGAVKCSRCRGAVRVAEAEGGRYAVHSAGAPVCEACAGSLPGGAGVVRVFAGLFPKIR